MAKGQFNLDGVVKDIVKAQFNLDGTIKVVTKIQANIGGAIKDLWKGSIIIDHSTPVTVVNSAYDTSGNGGRKLIRLNSGNLYTAMRNGTTAWYIYKSTDNGDTWSQFKTVTVSVNDIALATNGTNIYVIISYATSGAKFYSYDEAGTTLANAVNVDNGQSAMGLCSLTVDSSSNLHTAWSSKNSTYPNNFNIRYSKSTDGGVTWAVPEQISKDTLTNINNTNPCICIQQNGNPRIMFASANPNMSSYAVVSFSYNGSSWIAKQTYNGGNYNQSNPCVIVSPNGNIGCAWQGYGATHASTYHIFFSKSTDNGANWLATPIDVAIGQNPSLAVDENNAFFVQYDRSGVIYQKKSTDGVTWGAEATIGTGTNASTSTYNKFTQPLSIWKGVSSVLFAGVFET